MNTSIIKANLLVAAMLLTSCTENSHTDRESLATLYTLQSADMTDSPRVVAHQVTYYSINPNNGVLCAITKDGKKIHSSAYTLIKNK